MYTDTMLVKFLIVYIKLQELACGVTVSGSTDSEAYIRNKAILYGADNPSRVLTPYQQKMNTASQTIALGILISSMIVVN